MDETFSGISAHIRARLSSGCIALKTNPPYPPLTGGSFFYSPLPGGPFSLYPYPVGALLFYTPLVKGG